MCMRQVLTGHLCGWSCQLKAQGKRVEMMGDDTWLEVFPDHFSASAPFPSLNVKDIHTVGGAGGGGGLLVRPWRGLGLKGGLGDGWMGGVAGG